MVYYIVTDKLKRRPNAMIRVFHFLSLWWNFFVFFHWCLALISCPPHPFWWPIPELQGHIVRALLFQAFFFPSETQPWARRNLPTQWPAWVCGCVYARASCLCEKYIFHYRTLFSVLNGAFFLFFSLLVGTIETISRQSPVYCFCFSTLVWTEPCAFSGGVPRGGRHCSSLLGLAERSEGQLEMKLLLSTICLTL